MNVGPAEILLVMIFALIVLGPDRLPEAARQLGKAIGELKRISSGWEDDVREAFKEPSVSTPRPDLYPPTTDSADGDEKTPER